MTAAAPTTTYLYGGESRGYLHDLHVCRNFKLSVGLFLDPTMVLEKNCPLSLASRFPGPARPAPRPDHGQMGFNSDS